MSTEISLKKIKIIWEMNQARSQKFVNGGEEEILFKVAHATFCPETEHPAFKSKNGVKYLGVCAAM